MFNAAVMVAPAVTYRAVFCNQLLLNVNNEYEINIFHIKIPKLIFYGIRTKPIQTKNKLIEMDRRVIPFNDKQQMIRKHRLQVLFCRNEN